MYLQPPISVENCMKQVFSITSGQAKCHLQLACPGLAAAVLWWSPALSLVIIQDVQRLPSRSPLMSCHISVNELNIFHFFITHRLLFPRLLPMAPQPAPAACSHLSLAFTFTL